MNQLILTRAEPQLAHTLLLIFLALFSARTSRGSELGTRMLASILSGIHRAIPFCDDSSSRDQSGELLAAQLDLLFRCAHAASFGTAVQALMVLSHATILTNAASERFYRALFTSILHVELPNSSKRALFLNVVFKAMIADTHDGRVAAFAKRLLQACAHSPPAFICGALLLLSEAAKRKPSLRALLTAPPPTAAAAAAATGGGADNGGEGHGYVWNKREPCHSGAELSRLWELTQLLSHYHPSVVHFATSVATGESISYDGDPLRDFGLMPFLDKFVFKNPKSARRKQQGGSIMQPASYAAAAHSDAHSELALSHRGAIANLLAKPETRVAAHEKFFHTYFSRKREADEKLHRGRQGKSGGANAASGLESGAADIDDGQESSDSSGDDGLGAEGEAFATRLANSLMRDNNDPDDDYDDGYDDLGDGEDAELEDEEDGEEDDDGEEEDEEDDDDDALLSGALFGDGDGGDKLGEKKQTQRQKKRERGGARFAEASAFAQILEEAADENEGVHPRLAAWEGGKQKQGKRRKR